MLNTPRIINVHLGNAELVDRALLTVEAGAMYEVSEVIETHTVLGTDGGDVTVDVKKCTGTQAPSAGTSVLSSTFNLKSTINTPVSKVRGQGLATSLVTRTVKAGERLCLDFTGTQTAVEGVAVQIVLVPLRKSTSRGK